MGVSLGDRIRVPGIGVGRTGEVADPFQVGEVVEILGSDGKPPYLLQFEDGHACMLFSLRDCEVLRNLEN